MCYRTRKDTVCRHVRSPLSPEILKAGAVKGLTSVKDHHPIQEKLSSTIVNTAKELVVRDNRKVNKLVSGFLTLPLPKTAALLHNYMNDLKLDPLTLLRGNLVRMFLATRGSNVPTE